MARSLRSLAGVLYGGVQGFQVRKDIIITTYQHPSFVVVKFQIFFIKKKQNCWPTEPLKGTSTFYHFSHPVPLRGFF